MGKTHFLYQEHLPLRNSMVSVANLQVNVQSGTPLEKFARIYFTAISESGNRSIPLELIDFADKLCCFPF